MLGAAALLLLGSKTCLAKFSGLLFEEGVIFLENERWWFILSEGIVASVALRIVFDCDGP